MTTEQAIDEELSETMGAAVASETSARKGSKRPADVWLKKLLAPQKSILTRKAWIEAIAGIMAIGSAASLAAGLNALVVDKSGVAGLLPFAALLFVAILIRTGLSYWAGRLGHQVASFAKHDLRLRLAEKLARQNPLNIERKSAGEIAAVGSDVIEALDPYASRYLSLPLQLTVVPAAILIAVASVSWAIALLLLICGALIPVAMAIVGIRASKASDDQISALSDMSARFLDRISGMTTLRLFRAVGRTRSEFESLANDYRLATMRVLRIAFLSSAALELFAAFGIALTAIYVAANLMGGSGFGLTGADLSIGTGIFLLMLAPEFFSPLREFSAAYHDKATAQSAADRLRDILSLEDLDEPLVSAPAPDPTGSQDIQPITQVRFEACRLGYEVERGPVLTDVSCTFAKGERIAIVGASGAGKSTLLSALCGFLAPKAGTLSINGDPVPIDDAGWDSLRRSMAYIGQRPHMFHGSVLMNTRLAAPSAARDDVRQALEVAHADHFVQQLPRDLLTILGETGFGISGGQVRRLAIARAALGDASLLLCDEPTADLDADTAALVTDSLMKMAENRILVIATHDSKVAEQCDKILHVWDGKLSPIEVKDLPSVIGGDA